MLIIRVIDAYFFIGVQKVKKKVKKKCYDFVILQLTGVNQKLIRAMKTKQINSKRGQFKKFTAKEHTFLKKIIGGEEDDQVCREKIKW